MSKITAEEILKIQLAKMLDELGEKDHYSVDEIMQHEETKFALNAMQEHTKQNIEALRIEIRKKDGWIISKEELTVIFNQFLENIK